MKKHRIKLLVPALVCWLGISPLNSAAQEMSSPESDIPFSLRMCFFRGLADSTRLVTTVSVDNRNLLFYRGNGYYEACYQAFLNMRELKSRYIVQGDWDKKVRVPTYDETTLAEHYDPLHREQNVLPGKYEGFIEVKDVNAVTYGNGRIAVTVPDFTENFPKMSTPLFYDPGEFEGDTLPSVPGPGEPLKIAPLKYPAGKPIFLLIDVYADSSTAAIGWSLTAEVVKEMMDFPRVSVPLADNVTDQRKLFKVSTATMPLGTYRIEVKLRDVSGNTLTRAETFRFRIVKSAVWIEENYEIEVRYLKYLVKQSEIKGLLEVPEKDQPEALKAFWARMDPVPATAVNELKVQYFERIDYVNKHYTTEQREGWETNMGEVYIMLGPPSEIYGSRLNQIWVYDRENLVLYFFNFNLRNRGVFDDYIRDRRGW